MQPDPELWPRLSTVVARIMGLYFPQERWPELQRGIAAAACDLGFGDDANRCAYWLAGSPVISTQQLELLAAHLTVGETYFFRERHHFDFLSKQVIPELIARGERRLRIWSAGCCTGEEAYSIAMVLHQAIPDLEQWQVTLLATDINPRFLSKARAGIFGPWSFRGVSDQLKNQYFHKKAGGQWELSPKIRRLVRFAPLNLAEDSYPSFLNDTHAMNVIFCRNVLMYFSPGLAREVVEKFYGVQREGGWLIVGSSEALHLSGSPYTAVSIPDAVVYHKHASTSTSLSPETASAWPDQPAFGACTVSEPELSLSSGVQSVDDWRKRAAALYATGRYEEATAVIHQGHSVHSHEPADVGSLLLLARCLANQGQLDTALDCCGQAIAADRCDASSQYLRALILQERGDTDEAIHALRNVLFLDQRFVLAHVTLGTLARDRGQRSTANKHLQYALELLQDVAPDAALLDSEEMTAGQLTQMIHAIMEMEVAR